MALVTPISFSQDDQFMAYSTPDGTLQYWDIKNNKLKKTIKSSTHLTATCTCLKWGIKNDINIKSSPKKDSKASFTNYLVIGAQDGKIIFYNTVTDKFIKDTSNDGHSDMVTDLCFNPKEANILFSCSKDNQIIQWNLNDFKIQSKWKSGRAIIYSMCLNEEGDKLLTAGRSIKLWDIETKKALKYTLYTNVGDNSCMELVAQYYVYTFTGHATEIFNLSPVLKNDVTVDGDIYFISTAINDRHINLWYVHDNQKNSVATFLLPESPAQIFLSRTSNNTKSVYIVAVTKSGYLIIFQHIIKGPLKKPIQPRYFIQVASTTTSQIIPILFASVNSQQTEITFSYGELMNITFESIKFTDLQEKMTLIREEKSKKPISVETSITNVVTPNISKNLSVIDSSIKSEDTLRKQRTRSSELSIGERLVAIGSKTETKEIPKTDTMATLLCQGLQSQDKKILNNVLLRNDMKLITNTVRGLNIQVIVPLIKELAKRCYGHSQTARITLKWLQAVLVNHTTYLMTFPELVDLFSDIYQMMDARVSVFSRLSKLQGKLDIMLSQISLQNVSDDELDTSSQPPMLIYQDDSEDESNLFANEVESSDVDEWEDKSDDSDDSDEYMHEPMSE